MEKLLASVFVILVSALSAQAAVDFAKIKTDLELVLPNKQSCVVEVRSKVLVFWCDGAQIGVYYEQEYAFDSKVMTFVMGLMTNAKMTLVNCAFADNFGNAINHYSRERCYYIRK